MQRKPTVGAVLTALVLCAGPTTPADAQGTPWYGERRGAYDIAVTRPSAGATLALACYFGPPGEGGSDIRVRLEGKAVDGTTLFRFDDGTFERAYAIAGRIVPDCQECKETFVRLVERLRSRFRVEVSGPLGRRESFSLAGSSRVIGDCPPVARPPE